MQQIFILSILFLCRGLSRKLFRKRILMECENENKKYEQKNLVSENESVLPLYCVLEMGKRTYQLIDTILVFGTDPKRIGLLGKPPAVKQFLSYKSQ